MAAKVPRNKPKPWLHVIIFMFALSYVLGEMEMSKEINRNIYWDIVRCLAIIGVVLGHCVYNGHVIVFVYFFQLPVFFFVSGFLFGAVTYK